LLHGAIEFFSSKKRIIKEVEGESIAGYDGEMKKSLSFILLAFFMTSCTHVFYQPSSALYSAPETLGIQYENLYFETADKVRLHGWLFETPKEIPPKGLILFFHGNAQNITSHYLNLQWVTQFGYDVFIFDYRGYGLSKGRPNQKGVYQDALAAMNLAASMQKERGYQKMILYGQSLGGIIAAHALETDDWKNFFDLVVFDSTFYSYQVIARGKINQVPGLRVLRGMVPWLVSDSTKPTTIYQDLQKSVLVIHGKRDSIVEHEYGAEIYSRLKTEKKWFWEIEEGEHIDVFISHLHKYRYRFVELLDQKI